MLRCTTSMAKKFRRLQRISTIPILAALLLASNPAAAVGRQRTTEPPPMETSTDIAFPLRDNPDSRPQNK